MRPRVIGARFWTVRLIPIRAMINRRRPATRSRGVSLELGRPSGRTRQYEFYTQLVTSACQTTFLKHEYVGRETCHP